MVDFATDDRHRDHSTSSPGGNIVEAVAAAVVDHLEASCRDHRIQVYDMDRISAAYVLGPFAFAWATEIHHVHVCHRAFDCPCSSRRAVVDHRHRMACVRVVRHMVWRSAVAGRALAVFGHRRRRVVVRFVYFQVLAS